VRRVDLGSPAAPVGLEGLVVSEVQAAADVEAPARDSRGDRVALVVPAGKVLRAAGARVPTGKTARAG